VLAEEANENPISIAFAVEINSAMDRNTLDARFNFCRDRSVTRSRPRSHIAGYGRILVIRFNHELFRAWLFIGDNAVYISRLTRSTEELHARRMHGISLTLERL
jgi:hypothetical protein